jgi:hypothetical protein
MPEFETIGAQMNRNWNLFDQKIKLWATSLLPHAVAGTKRIISFTVRDSHRLKTTTSRSPGTAKAALSRLKSFLSSRRISVRHVKRKPNNINWTGMKELTQINNQLPGNSGGGNIIVPNAESIR